VSSVFQADPTVALLHLAPPYAVKIGIDRPLVPKQPDGFGLIVVWFVIAAG
jgi:hypothetical protein